MNSLGRRHPEQPATDVLTSFHFSAIGRDINDRIHAAAILMPQTWDCLVFCHSANGDCEAQIQLTPQKYEEIRSRPETFVVLPGHHSPESERVLESDSNWTVVEKIKAARRISSVA